MEAIAAVTAEQDPELAW